MTIAYPLAWPEGWARTPAAQQLDSKYRFGRNQGRERLLWTFASARDALAAELDRIKARNVVLSTNYKLRLDGLPRDNGPTPADKGIAVYFTLQGRPMVMACDMHVRAEENMRSLALSIEAMRALERHGGGRMMERAFTGFAALPPPSAGGTAAAQRSWRRVLGFTELFWENLNPSGAKDVVNARYRECAKKAMADQAELLALNLARDEALREIGHV